MGAAGLSEAELAAAKRYMRVDGTEDDDVVCLCVLGARDYLLVAGVSLPEAGTSRRNQYDLVCHALALGSYDQRDALIVDGVGRENPQLRRMITQLKLTEPN